MRGGSARTGASRATFVWGLKRSGIHLVVGWLYANHGGVTEDPFHGPRAHPQLGDGYEDAARGVAFFNNCGGLHSRRYRLGSLCPGDFDRAIAAHRVAIFGIEDCSLDEVDRTVVAASSARVLVLRDPLNNLASRLEAAKVRPQVFPVDDAYLDLYEAYCAEALGRTEHLAPRTVVAYDHFVQDRDHREALAAELGLANVDAVARVSSYGGGSSFSGQTPSEPASLLARHRDHPVPPALIERLLDRPAIRDACEVLFGYVLAERTAQG